ncbi:MAG: threonine/serine exporter family protein [Prolixibacteraceae bacterium]|nr:threonine/serine exporter family protein [Prolixibacteraceae bacterium]
MEIMLLLEKGLWAGFAALGFAILFNVPPRTLFAIWLIGALGGLAKFSLLVYDVNIIMASFAGATLIGILSIPLAHKIHSPPLIFSIPAVIPMVPGAYAYRMMLNLINIAIDSGPKDNLVADMFQNGMNVAFILLAISVGVAVPMLITRKDSAKRIRIKL